MQSIRRQVARLEAFDYRQEPYGRTPKQTNRFVVLQIGRVKLNDDEIVTLPRFLEEMRYISLHLPKNLSAKLSLT